MLVKTVLLLFFVSFGACDPSVVIVGAGASGIAAAARLLKNDITNITILEAEDRIGGRVYSVPLGDGYVDLGAEWCHGEKDNIVYDMVKDLNILQHTNKFYPEIYHSKFKRLDQNFSNLLLDTFDELIGEPNKNSSIGERLIARYEEVISQWKNDPRVYALAQEAITVFEAYVIGYEGAFSWFDISDNDDYILSDGDLYLHWNGHGFKTILDLLMQKYPDASKSLPIDDKVLLNKEVHEIAWSSKQAVVKCSDSSTYVADHVIVTVSLGVLKHQHTSLFRPKLPSDKLQAIEQLGIAAVHKVLLHFPQRWWNDSYTGNCFLWNKDDAKHISFGEGPVKDGISWLTSVSVLLPVLHNPNVLEVWILGHFVPKVEQCPDEVVINGVMYLLDYFGVAVAETITRPDIIIRNNWYTNPHFRGTYSFQTPRTRHGYHSDPAILSEPLGNNREKPNLLFAGEASNPTHYSTVQGAIETGFREADRILKMYK
ncbi:hypothetical protein RN001_010335 [Aquatica leii]|uniref:Amine oxidase domain-containing protein n=1 Tax=Aquatica leii TaxID=1421715 RepID=A0AAN7SFZ4_9COLE|nr:hypothetical protein RN001_010335 [Aquatica leii]